MYNYTCKYFCINLGAFELKIKSVNKAKKVHSKPTCFR